MIRDSKQNVMALMCIVIDQRVEKLLAFVGLCIVACISWVVCISAAGLPMPKPMNTTWVQEVPIKPSLSADNVRTTVTR